MYRVLRYRLAWFLLSLLGYYLALNLVLFIAARHEATLPGPFVTCTQLTGQSGAASGYRFTVQNIPGRQLELSDGNIEPPISDSFCSEQLVSVTYETNTLEGPLIVDRVTLRDTTTGTATTYTTPAGRDFTAAKVVSLLIWGGGLGTVSTALLLVAALWRYFGNALQGKDARRNEKQTGGSGGAGTSGKGGPTPLPAAFLEQVREDLAWLEAIPWGAEPLADVATAYQRFHRGIGLVRGWQGNEARLIEGIQLLERCPSALAETGAAEAILQLSTFDVATCAPEGARAALRHAERAIALAPNVVEAHLARIHALAALEAYEPGSLKQAQEALRAAQRAAPDHPRLPSAGAAVYLAQRHYPLVITSLRRAIKLAPTQEEADALLDQFAQVLARSGELRRAMNLRAQLAAKSTRRRTGVPVASPAGPPDELDGG